MKRKLFNYLFITILSLFIILPFLFDQVYIGHDTLFHLSRIQGYATSIKNGNFIPDIYVLKNDNFGYGSALFYCDYLLLIPALLYNLNVPITICYSLLIFIITWFTAYSMYKLCAYISNNKYLPYLACCFYIANPLHISNMYTRGALGETMAAMFLPWIILGLYQIIINKENKLFSLTFGLTATLLTHNLSFLITSCMCLILCFLYAQIIGNNKDIFMNLCKCCLISVGLSACFIFPMLQQINSQSFYLHYYGNFSNLNESILPFYELFNPFTVVNGYANANYEYNQILNVSPGLIVILFSWLIIFIKDNNTTLRFMKRITIIGYLFALLSFGIINFDLLSIIKIIQFPFRLLSITSLLLSISCAYLISYYFYYPKVLSSIIICLTVYATLLTIPYISHENSIILNSKVTYQQLLDGSIIDPYYGNSSYVRLEVAGADYLPQGNLNTKDLPKYVINDSQEYISDITIKDNIKYFTIQNSDYYTLPVTYYLGYQVCQVNNNQLTNCNKVDKTYDGRIRVYLKNSGQYALKYEKTTLHKVSIAISTITLLIVIIISLKNKYNKINK